MTAVEVYVACAVRNLHRVRCCESSEVHTMQTQLEHAQSHLEDLKKFLALKAM